MGAGLTELRIGFWLGTPLFLFPFVLGVRMDAGEMSAGVAGEVSAGCWRDERRVCWRDERRVCWRDER